MEAPSHGPSCPVSTPLGIESQDPHKRLQNFHCLQNFHWEGAGLSPGPQLPQPFGGYGSMTMMQVMPSATGRWMSSPVSVSSQPVVSAVDDVPVVLSQTSGGP